MATLVRTGIDECEVISTESDLVILFFYLYSFT